MRFHAVLFAAICALAIAAPSESGEAEAEYDDMGKKYWIENEVHSAWFMGLAESDDVKILRHSTVSVCLYFSLCVLAILRTA